MEYPASGSQVQGSDVSTIDRVHAGAGSPHLKEYSVAGYALVVTVKMNAATWPNIWYSWLSLKGHLQAFHYVQETYAFADRNEEVVTAVFVVVCESEDAAAAWLQEGYTVDRMLDEMGVPASDYTVQLMRDFS